VVREWVKRVLRREEYVSSSAWKKLSTSQSVKDISGVNVPLWKTKSNEEILGLLLTQQEDEDQICSLFEEDTSFSIGYRRIETPLLLLLTLGYRFHFYVNFVHVICCIVSLIVSK